MSSEKLVRWSGFALILGGFSYAMFLLLHPYGGVVGAETAGRLAWVPAHTFHFLGALLTAYGLIGLYAGQLKESGMLGFLGFFLAFGGTVMFAGTGMITAFVWPVVAQHAPVFVAAGGPMFTDPLTVWVIRLPYILMVAGFLLLGAATLRAKLLPAWGSWVTMAGVVMFSVPVEPVGPVPWWVRLVGAVVFGVGLMLWGHALWSGASGRPKTQRAREGPAA